MLTVFITATLKAILAFVLGNSASHGRNLPRRRHYERSFLEHPETLTWVTGFLSDILRLDDDEASQKPLLNLHHWSAEHPLA